MPKNTWNVHCSLQKCIFGVNKLRIKHHDKTVGNFILFLLLCVFKLVFVDFLLRNRKPTQAEVSEVLLTADALGGGLVWLTKTNRKPKDWLKEWQIMARKCSSLKYGASGNSLKQWIVFSKLPVWLYWCLPFLTFMSPSFLEKSLVTWRITVEQQLSKLLK